MLRKFCNEIKQPNMRIDQSSMYGQSTAATHMKLVTRHALVTTHLLHTEAYCTKKLIAHRNLLHTEKGLDRVSARI